MRRALRVGLLATTALLAGGPAAAQVRVYFGASGDTAIGAVPGVEVRWPIRAYNPYFYGYYYYYYYIYRARLTFFFDSTKVEVLGVDASTYPGLYYNVQTSSTPGSFTVRADGYAYGNDTPLLALRLRLKSGVTDGAWIWVRPDTVAVQYYSNLDATHRSSIGQVCHATQAFGDVDGNLRIDSRDALITLSAAVGLPVSGFNLAIGDVDRDGLTNSRDALMMLSYAIGLPYYYYGAATNRVGEGVPDACPSLAAPGETVVFKRVSSTSGLFRLDAASTTPAVVSTDNGDDYPRLDSAGQAVVFNCRDTSSYLQICRAAADGTNRRMLTGPGSPSSYLPDWSPDGTKIAFLRSGAIYTMDSAGASQAQLGASPISANGLAWSRDGARIAYFTSSGIFAVRVDSLTSVQLNTGVSISDAAQVRWSPDGSSVAFSRSDGTIWSVPAAGGAPVRLTTILGGWGFDWATAGLVFTAYGPSGTYSVWLLQGGPTGPIVRVTSPGSGEGDYNPAFRRSP